MFLEINTSNYKNHQRSQLSFLARQEGRIDQKFISNIVPDFATTKFISVFGFNHSDNTDLLELFEIVAAFMTSKNHPDQKSFSSNTFTKHQLMSLIGANELSPTVVLMHFFLDNRIFEYAISVLDGQIITETITQDYPLNENGKPQLVLSRSLLPNDNYKYTSDNGIFEKESEFTIANSLESIVLSCSKVHPVAKLIFDYMKNKVTTNLNTDENLFNEACLTYQDQEIFTIAQEILRSFDLLSENAEVVISGDTTNYSVDVHYNIKDSDKSMTLNYSEQASGFKKTFILLSKIIPTLLNGGLCLIDHIDDNLHPVLAKALVSLFSSNKYHQEAQCIATLTSTYVLKHIDHDQAYFIDTNNNNHSTRCATQFKFRKSADLEDMLYSHQLIKIPTIDS